MTNKRSQREIEHDARAKGMRLRAAAAMEAWREEHGPVPHALKPKRSKREQRDRRAHRRLEKAAERHKDRKLGKLGAASAVKHIDPKSFETKS
jgi:hypothetical protein